MNALAPLPHTAPRTAPIYCHTGSRLVSTIDAGSLGIPVLKHLHHVWPHYVVAADGSRQLYLLVHGWRDGASARCPLHACRAAPPRLPCSSRVPPRVACTGKFAVLKHEGRHGAWSPVVSRFDPV